MGRIPYVTRQFVWDMITEINENITAVDHNTINHTTATVLDSIDGHCTWEGTDFYVQYHEIRTLVNDWIVSYNAAHEVQTYNDEEITMANITMTEITTPEEITTPANLLELFPIRIRSENQIAQIHHCYTIGLMMANTMHPTAEQANSAITQWIAKGDDECLAMALAYREYVTGR
jgi:hypothetical protein